MSGSGSRPTLRWVGWGWGGGGGGSVTSNCLSVSIAGEAVL